MKIFLIMFGENWRDFLFIQFQSPCGGRESFRGGRRAAIRS
jgi:hypothetical protein